MTAASPFVSPPSRALHAWSRDLVSRQPRRLWFAALHFHRLEAAVFVTRSTRLDPVHVGFLKFLASSGPAMEPPLLKMDWAAQQIDSLKKLGLVEMGATGPCPTPSGRDAATRGAYDFAGEERRSFTFVDNAACNHPHRYLAVHRALAPLTHAPEHWSFDPAVLQACVARSNAWKSAHQFPIEILGLARYDTKESWQRIMIDYPEQATLVLAETVEPSGGTALHGFTARTENWTLFRDAPLFSLPHDWLEVLPDLDTAPTVDEWQHSWLAWAQAHAIGARTQPNVPSVMRRASFTCGRRSGSSTL